MQLFKLTLIFVIFNAVHAKGLEKRSRAECFRVESYRASEERPEADAIICYHGKNSATSESSSFTNRSEGKYGYLHYTKCSRVGMDCFWMKAPNQWEGYADGGSDNLAMLLAPNCTYDPAKVKVVCK